MSGSFFLDTNVLVYTFDGRAPEKRARAMELVQLALGGDGLISFQVVQEFLNVATRRFEKPLSSDEARIYLDDVLLPLCRVHSSPMLYRDALALRLRWQFNWYDAVIVSAAMLGGCSVLYTEDLQHEQQIEGLRIVNPFLAC